MSSNESQKKQLTVANETNSRRDFLKKAVVAGSALSVPYFWTSAPAQAVSPNDKKTIACIGIGGSRGRHNRGRGIARDANRFGEMIAICDVDSLHTAEFNKELGGKANEYTDYRKLFEQEKPDVVTIGTPDHWHVPIAIHALRSGADVYCEKPLTLTISEGEIIKKAVQETGRVFQVGTQQRSEMNRLFLYAIAIVRSGRLGKNVNAHCAIGGAPKGGPFENTAIPPDLDWDLWLGPAPKADYCEERRKQFRWYLEYSGGKMTDWGAHHVDIAQWALGLDETGPTQIAGTGEMTPIIPAEFNWSKFLDGETELPNGFNAATRFNINLDFASGQRISVNNHYKNGKTNFGNGILFEGDKGRIFVNRTKLQGKPVEDLFGSNLEQKNVDGKRTNNYSKAISNLDSKVRAEFDDAFLKLHKGKKPTSQMGNFFACLDDRSEPVSDVESHVNTMNSCHMCNIALMLGRELKWDQSSRDFIGDDQASALRDRKRRSGFEI